MTASITMTASATNGSANNRNGNGSIVTLRDALPAAAAAAAAAASSSSPASIRSLCDSLQTLASDANDLLRDFLTYRPSARNELTALSREVADLQMVSRVVGSSGGHAEDGTLHYVDPSRGPTATNGSGTLLHPAFLAAVRRVVANAVDVVGDLRSTLQRPGRDATVFDDANTDSDPNHRAWLAHVAETVSRLVRPAETCRMAMNMALDAFLMASNSRPSTDVVQDLPAYQSSQTLQEMRTLQARLAVDHESDNVRVQAQRPIVSDFLDALRQQMDHTGRSSGLPPTISLDVNVGSQSLPQTPLSPAYNAVDITHPAPRRIELRHGSRVEIGPLEATAITTFTRSSSAQVVVVVSFGHQCKSKLIRLDGSPHSSRFPESAAFDKNAFQHVCALDGTLTASLSDLESSPLASGSWPARKPEKPIIHLAGVSGYNNIHREELFRGTDAHPLALSDDSGWLAMATSPGSVCVYNTDHFLPSRERPTTLSVHFDKVTHAAFTPDSAALVTMSRDRTIRITSLGSWQTLGKLDLETVKPPSLLGVTPDGKVIISVWGDVVYRWNWVTGSLDSFALGSRRGKDGWPLAISRDCRFLACRSDEGVDVSDLHSGRMLHSIQIASGSGSGHISSATFTANARFLLLVKAVPTGIQAVRSVMDVWELIY